MNIASLNQRIKRSGLKKKHIAKKSGIHFTQLSRIINGVTKKPRSKTMQRIEKVLKNANV